MFEIWKSHLVAVNYIGDSESEDEEFLGFNAESI